MGSNDEKTSIIAAEVWDRIRDKVSEGDGKTGDFVAIIQAAIEKATKNIADFAAEVVEKAKDLQSQLNEAQGAYKAEIKSHKRTFDLLKQSRAAHASEPRLARATTEGEEIYYIPPESRAAHASETKRLDWLEATVRNEGGELNIHNDMKSRDCLGLTIQNRSLREAIDAAMQREKP